MRTEDQARHLQLAKQRLTRQMNLFEEALGNRRDQEAGIARERAAHWAVIVLALELGC